MTGSAVYSNTASQIGGGVYGIESSGPGVTVNLTDTEIRGNIAQSTSAGGGGLAFNKGNLTLTRVLFQDNTAYQYGGALYHANSTGISALNAVTMTQNTASAAGGGIYNNSGTLNIISSALYTNSVPSYISTGMGSGIDILNGAVYVTSTLISGCSAKSGGGIVIGFGSLTLSNSTLINNAAGQFGGGLHITAMAQVTLNGVSLEVNSAGTYNDGVGKGGAIYFSSLNPLTINRSQFIRNLSGRMGGAIYSYETISVTSTLFEGNVSGYNNTYGGGAIGAEGNSIATVEGCLFTGNRSLGNGGALYITPNLTQQFSLVNSTLVSNTAYYYGAIYASSMVTWDHPMLVANSLLWGNTGSGSPVNATANVVMHYSDYQGGWSGTGANNINSDPLLRAAANPGADATWGTSDDVYGDQRLKVGSPAINVGSNAYVTATVDLSGLARISGGGVDMGAYEFNVDNLHPLANAGPNHQVSTNQLAALDGSLSTDPDGDLPLTYGWVQTGGAAPVVLSDPTSAAPTFTAYATGPITFTLTVTDSAGLVSTRTRSASWLSAHGQPPTRVLTSLRPPMRWLPWMARLRAIPKGTTRWLLPGPKRLALR